VIKVILSGACGRMGQALVAASRGSDIRITGGLERPGHPALGTVLPQSEAVISADLSALLPAGDVLVEFSDSPQAALEHVRQIAQAGIPGAVGTTGFDGKQQEEIRRLSERVALLVAPNMAIGISVLYTLVEQATRLLGEAYDVEIIEAHHRLKKDAPSGTAKRLAALVKGIRGAGVSEVYGREGLVGERGRGEIGVLAVRAGDIVGEHTVLFAGPGERVELAHRAQGREAFAQGALRAIRFVIQAKPGLYGMAEAIAWQ
jgi:4-hydroxy-tetrahydrodipicolinate reductase